MESDAKKLWSDNLSEELDFWWRWLTEDSFIPHREFRMDSRQEMGRDLLSLLPEDQPVCAVLDVGSGPVSGIGAVAPGKLINLYLTDALAHEYNKMLNRLGIVTAVWPLPVEAEKLTTVFPDDYFDLVVCFNALDHTYDPIGAIREMITVCKPGCWVFLGHHNNVAVIENYRGLHQWNLDCCDERFVVWNRDGRHDVLDSVPGIASIRLKQAAVPEGNEPFLYAWLQKASV